jgi:hypothetical protein
MMGILYFVKTMDTRFWGPSAWQLFHLIAFTSKHPDDVLNQMSSISLGHHLSEESSRLLKVVVRVLMGVSASVSAHSKRCHLLSGVLDRAVVAVGLVVNGTALISINSARAISLVVGYSSSVRAVDGDLVIVGTESVSVGVGVREDSALEHLISRELNTGDDMGWGECDLLNLGKVILRVSVKIEFSNRDQRIVAVGNNLGHIEDVKLVILTFLLRNELNIPCP